MTSPTVRDTRIGPFTERRKRLLAAAELLAANCDRKKYVPTYARMNPGVELRFNSFEFGDSWRLTILGPWLYIRAPKPLKIAALQRYSKEQQKKRHFVGPDQRYLLTQNGSEEIVRGVIEEILRGVS